MELEDQILATSEAACLDTPKLSLSDTILWLVICDFQSQPSTTNGSSHQYMYQIHLCKHLYCQNLHNYCVHFLRVSYKNYNHYNCACIHIQNNESYGGYHTKPRLCFK